MPRAAPRPSGRPGLVPVATLAAGGMGTIEIVLRREGEFQRLYARKRPQAALRGDAEVVQMFLEEGRLAGLVRHANVVSVLDVGEDFDGPFLLMEYVDGVSAATLLEELALGERPLPLALCLTVVAQAARGLHAAHELAGSDGQPLGIVHRDVSPQNILVGFDGVVRVTDFGIAKAIGGMHRTSTGLLKGNVGYMAPERLRFRPADRRSDLFSLGVVLYELLAGRRLYRSDDVDDTARRVLDEPPPDVGELRPDVPPELGGLLFELLAKDPADRPQTALDVAQRLEAILSALAAETGPFDLAAFLDAALGPLRAARAKAIDEGLARAEEVAARQTRRRRWRWPAVAVGAAAVGAVVAGVMGGNQPVDIRLFGGAWHTCAIREGGNLHCWGKNNESQLGVNSTVNSPVPHPVFGPLPAVVSAAGGKFHTCAVVADGRVLCWGRNHEGQLGIEGVQSEHTPALVPGLERIKKVTAAEQFSCALREDGRVLCWGHNHGHALGMPTPGAFRHTPEPVPDLADVVEIESGGHTTCARLRARGVRCFGSNDRGQLGDGSTEPRVGPVAVRGLEDAADLTLGSRFGCAIRTDHSLVCWGDNEVAQLGQDPRQVSFPTPTRVPGLTDVVTAAALGGGVCALVRGGRVLCWGRGDWGSFGDGRSGAALVRAQPGPVTGLTDAVALVGGAIHACAVRANRSVVCWGGNDNGQLGDGSFDNRPTPVSMAAMF